jgi:hypothetical protein
MHVKAPHITEWLRDHDHWILGAEVSEEFNSFLSAFPWATGRIRWSQLPHEKVELPDENELEGFVNLMRRTPAGAHELVFLMYSAGEPGIACRTQDALPDLDYLYSGAPGPRYFCGADQEKDAPVPLFAQFAEYDGDLTITSRIP